MLAVSALERLLVVPGTQVVNAAGFGTTAIGDRSLVLDRVVRAELGYVPGNFSPDIHQDTRRVLPVFSSTFFLKVGTEGNLAKHEECAEHIRAVAAKVGLQLEVFVVPDGWNTCLRIELKVDRVEVFHMYIGSLADWAAVQYGRAIVEINN